MNKGADTCLMEHPLESEGVCEDLRSQLLCGMCKTLLRVPVGCGACPHAWCSQCLAGFVAAREDGINGKKQTRGAEFECPAEGCTARARAKDYKVLRHLQALTNALAGHGKRGRGGSGRDPSSATGFGNSGDHDGEHGGGSYSRSERLSSSSSGGGGGSSTCRLNFTFKGMTASKARSCYSKPQLRGVQQCEGTAQEKLERDKARLRRFQTQFNAEFRSGATGMTHEQFVKVFNRQELARERAEEGGGKIQVSSNGRGYRALETKMRKAMKAMAKKGKKEAMKKVYKKNGSLRPSGFKTRVLYGLRATVPAKFRVVYSEKAQRPYVFLPSKADTLISYLIQSHIVSSRLVSSRLIPSHHMTGFTSTQRLALARSRCQQRFARS